MNNRKLEQRENVRFVTHEKDLKRRNGLGMALPLCPANCSLPMSTLHLEIPLKFL